MAGSPVSIEALRALASLSGLHLSDKKLEELLPQAQRAFEALAGLGALDLEAAEPAVTFSPDRE